MKFIRRLLIIAVIFAVFVGGAVFWLSDKYVVPIVMYHKVEDSDIMETDVISPKNFRKHMAYIAERGYNVLTLDEFVEGVKNKRRFPRNSVVITFDDGHANNLTTIPILKEYRFPATFFVSPEYTKPEYNKEEDYLDWAQLQIIANEGFSIGSHGMTQAYLPDMPSEKRRFELEESKRVLEEKLGVSVDYFSYPVSGFTEEIKDEVRRAGYKGAVVTNRGNDRFNRDIYEINRIRLCDKDNSDFVLWVKLTGYYNIFRTLKRPY